MPAAFTPPWNVQTPMRVPAAIRENASATATAYRSSRSISIGIPSRPSALFTRQTGNVETQPTPSCLRMRAMPVATSIVMDQPSYAREHVFAVAVALTIGYPRGLLNRDPEGWACPSLDLSAVAGLDQISCMPRKHARLRDVSMVGVVMPTRLHISAMEQARGRFRAVGRA